MDETVVSENQLIGMFGYECIMKIDDDRKFMFEVFVPVELKGSVKHKYSSKNVSE